MQKGAPSVNPTGRRGKTPKIPDQYKVDGYQSTLTGLGISGYDKRLLTNFTTEIITRTQAASLWASDDIAARAIDIPVEDSFRQGFTFDAKAKEGSDLDIKEVQDAVQTVWDELGVLETGQQALGYEMAYGGCGVLLGYEGLTTEELASTVNPHSLRPLAFLNVFEPEELQTLYHYLDPLQPRYGDPAVFTFTPLVTGQGEKGGTGPGFRIHESNMHIMPGIKVSKSLDESNGLAIGWGVSVYTRLWSVLRDFNTAWGGVGNLVTDFSQTVMKLKNLAQLLAETGGSTALKTRLQSMDYGRSILRAIVIDSEEDVERKTTNVTGLPELLQQYMGRISSAAGGIPLTKLFGISPGGLNATGESDINQWDDRIKSIQDKRVIPYLRRITEALIASGQIANTDQLESWKIEANPLRQPTEQEVTATRATQAQADVAYINSGVLTPDDVANSRFGGDSYSLQTVVDWEEREELKQLMIDAGPEETAEPTAPGQVDPEEEPADDDEDTEEDDE